MEVDRGDSVDNDRPVSVLSEGRMTVELNPNDAYTLHTLGNKSGLTGDPQGIPKIVLAQRLGPKDAQLPCDVTLLARAYVNARDHGSGRAPVEHRPDSAPGRNIRNISISPGAARGRSCHDTP